MKTTHREKNVERRWKIQEDREKKRKGPRGSKTDDLHCWFRGEKNLKGNSRPIIRKKSWTERTIKRYKSIRLYKDARLKESRELRGQKRNRHLHLGGGYSRKHGRRKKEILKRVGIGKKNLKDALGVRSLIPQKRAAKKHKRGKRYDQVNIKGTSGKTAPVRIEQPIGRLGEGLKQGPVWRGTSLKNEEVESKGRHKKKATQRTADVLNRGQQVGGKKPREKDKQQGRKGSSWPLDRRRKWLPAGYCFFELLGWGRETEEPKQRLEGVQSLEKQN